MGSNAAYLYPPPGRASVLARIVTYVINPVFAGIFIVVLLTFRALEDPVQATKWVSFAVLLVAIPPVSYVVYLVKIGYLVDIFMPDRKRRIKPMSVIIAWIVISILILIGLQAPLTIILLLVASVVQIGLMLIITFVLKISFHTAVISAAAAITLLVGGKISLVVVPMVPLVGWARVHLRRHTRQEVLIGCLTGAIVGVLAYLTIQNYVNI
jgi:hypothetical protein